MKNHIELVEVMGRLIQVHGITLPLCSGVKQNLVFPGKGVGKPGKGGKGSSPITLIKTVVNHP